MSANLSSSASASPLLLQLRNKEVPFLQSCSAFVVHLPMVLRGTIMNHSFIIERKWPVLGRSSTTDDDRGGGIRDKTHSASELPDLVTLPAPLPSCPLLR